MTDDAAQLTDETDQEGLLLRDVINQVIPNAALRLPPHVVIMKAFVVYRAFVKQMMLVDSGVDPADDRIAALDRFIDRLQ